MLLCSGVRSLCLRCGVCVPFVRCELARYGARPLKRNVHRLLLNPLAKLMLAGSIKDGDTVEVTVPQGRGTGGASRSPLSEEEAGEDDGQLVIRAVAKGDKAVVLSGK